MSEKTASMKDELCVGTVSSKGLTDVLHRHREADERGKDERNCHIIYSNYITDSKKIMNPRITGFILNTELCLI